MSRRGWKSWRRPGRWIALLGLCVGASSLSGCFLLRGRQMSPRPGVLYGPGQRSSVSEIVSPRRTRTRRSAFVSGGRIVQLDRRQVTVRMWIYSRSARLTHPRVYYRFLIDSQGNRAETSNYQLLGMRDLTRFYPCSWRQKVKVGSITNRRGQTVANVYRNKIRHGTCRDPYYRRDFRVTFRIPPKVDLRSRSLTLRMEAYGSNYSLAWQKGAPAPVDDAPPRYGSRQPRSRRAAPRYRRTRHDATRDRRSHWLGR